jgi:hypothetical protein
VRDMGVDKLRVIRKKTMFEESTHCIRERDRKRKHSRAGEGEHNAQTESMSRPSFEETY